MRICKNPHTAEPPSPVQPETFASRLKTGPGCGQKICAPPGPLTFPPETSLYMTFCGFPSRYFFTLSNTITALFTMASFVAKATCGVNTVFFAVTSG